MGRHAFLARLLIPLVFLSPLGGCQTLEGSRPVAVLVRDAESKAPLAGANVCISYSLSRAIFPPAASSATTPADGAAHLTAAPLEELGLS
jgi:hypothetical protein